MIGAEDETQRPESLDAAEDETLQSRGGRVQEDTGKVARGTVVGRYVVLQELGAGAMGRVYAAYDPKLDRRVALKVLRIDRGQGALYRRAERRLLREAQALAKLSHPNVVAVHDVESLRGRLVVAMDFIEGRTLRKWLAEEERSWPQVLAVMQQAGEGLAAAHRAGLVHRDFKPDNLMIGDDGRVHVVDFGLARAFDPGTLSEEHGPEGDEGAVPVDGEPTQHTRSVGRAGTPAYMAPEQHLGDGVGPASDQFAFCVVLYEALYGHRPFEGKTLVTLTTAVLQGRVVVPPRDSDVPPRIRDAVLQGLAVDPERRHADMDALLAALRYDPGVRRRRIVTAVAGVALVAVAAIGYLDSGEPTGPQPCTGGRDKLAGIWDDDVRERARAAVLATERSYSAHGWNQAQPYLDGWADDWARMHDDACAATQLRGEQSERLLDLRMACLDRHRQQLAATSAVLVEADDQVVQRILQLATGLPPLRECADVDALTAAVPPPRDPRVREQVEQVRADLARAQALGLAGKYDQGLRAASEATDRAATLGYAPAHAEALLRRGYLEDKQGDSASAEVTLSAAAWTAQRARHDAVAARATTELAYVVGAQLDRVDDGLQWARHADAAVGRLGDRLAMARLLNNRGVVLTTAGRLDEAEVELRRALELRLQLLPPDHPDIATTRTNVGVVLDELGRPDDALAVYDVALEERERSLGREHPRVAALLTNSSHLLAMRGRTDEALARVQRAIEIYRRALGPHHPELASAYNNLATVYFATEDYDPALEAMGEALEIWKVVHEPNHPDIGDAHFNMGSVLFKLARYGPAREHLERAHRVFVGAYGPDHPDVALALINLGILDANEGAFEQAREHHRRAVEIYRETVPADHPELARVLSALARDCLGAERWMEAEEAADESLRIYSGRDDIEPWRRAEARLLAAQAQWAGGGDRSAAVTEARRAFAEAEDEDIRQEAAEWLSWVGRPVPPA